MLWDQNGPWKWTENYIYIQLLISTSTRACSHGNVCIRFKSRSRAKVVILLLLRPWPPGYYGGFRTPLYIVLSCPVVWRYAAGSRWWVFVWSLCSTSTHRACMMLAKILSATLLALLCGGAPSSMSPGSNFRVVLFDTHLLVMGLEGMHLVFLPPAEFINVLQKENSNIRMGGQYAIMDSSAQIKAKDGRSNK